MLCTGITLLTFFPPTSVLCISLSHPCVLCDTYGTSFAHQSTVYVTTAGQKCISRTDWTIISWEQGFVFSATYRNVSKSYKAGQDWRAQEASSLNMVGVVAVSMAANSNTQLFSVRLAEKKLIMVLFSNQKLIFNLICTIFDIFRLLILIITKLFYQFESFYTIGSLLLIPTCTLIWLVPVKAFARMLISCHRVVRLHYL